jgi:uncharacterized protein
MKGKTALITGATSGIGAAYAKKLAALGHDLIITGRRADIIQRLADEITARYQVCVDVVIVELGEDTGVRRIVERINKVDSIEFLVNNAGFGTYDTFAGAALAEQRAMVAVHVDAAMALVHAVLPQMLLRGRGTIINVSSMAAFFPAPKNSIYAGTKSFLVLFSESLYMEMRERGIRVQALCPGFTRTDFHEKIEKIQADMPRLERFHWMSPDAVVDYSLKTLGTGRVVCIPGFWNRLLTRAARLMPRSIYYRVVK